MWRRARKKAREEAIGEPPPSAPEPEERPGPRLRGLDGYEFDENEAKEVEARIRRISYGHKVEK